MHLALFIIHSLRILLNISPTHHSRRLDSQRRRRFGSSGLIANRELTHLSQMLTLIDLIDESRINALFEEVISDMLSHHIPGKRNLAS